MKYDALIVLGRGISENGTLPDVSVKSVERANELFDSGKIDRVVFCGKWSRHYKYSPPITEASAMKELAIKNGIPEKNIITEEESLDTIGNFYYAKKNILEPNNWKKLLLITVSNNDPRAPLTAQYVLGPSYTCDYESIDYQFPPEISTTRAKREQEKVQLLKKFFQKLNIKPGDDEKIYQEHLNYINTHNILPTP